MQVDAIPGSVVLVGGVSNETFGSAPTGLMVLTSIGTQVLWARTVDATGTVPASKLAFANGVCATIAQLVVEPPL